MDKIKQKSIWAALFSFIMAVGLILAITWPWVLHFHGEFLNHWDPPFHAWKLEFIARRIIAGDWFVGSTNTNMLYPFNGTLYYEALQWPPSIFAAILFKFTPMSSELIYHITLVVFWALSAPCMYYLLRQLGCNIVPSVIGSLVFCIIPHRISYMIEFQMEMIFAMPLFFAFVYRFLCKPSIKDGLLAAFFWWLFAVTELYQAIFVAMAAPFLVLAFLTKTPKLLTEKKFWISAGLTVVFGIALLFIMLTPYLQQHSEGAVMRELTEVKLHSAQPFSWIVPYGRFFLWTFSAKVDEFSMYPTIPVIILFIVAGVYWILREYKNKESSKYSFLSSLLLFASILGFFVFCLLIQFTGVPKKNIIWDMNLLLMYLAIIGLFLILVFHEKDASNRTLFMKGMLAASVLFFFLSLGPVVSLGLEESPILQHKNTVYLTCYKRILPFLSGFRVVSRFGIFVLFFMIIAATIAYDLIHRRFLAKKWRILGLGFAILVLICVVIESIPNKQWVSRYITVDNPRESPAIARFVEKHPICTLAICPSGPRRIEGPRMFSLLKGDWPYVYAWGGYFPPYSDELSDEINSHNPEKLHYELSKFFPEVVLMLDKANLVPIKKRHRNKEEYKKWLIPGQWVLDFERIYSSIADVQDSDDRFTIFKLKPYPPQKEAIKIFRSDVARLNPNLSCKITSSPNTSISLQFNGELIETISTDVNGTAFVDIDMPQKLLEKASFNSFSVQAEGTNLVSVLDFSLTSDDGSYIDVMKPYSE